MEDLCIRLVSNDEELNAEWVLFRKLSKVASSNELQPIATSVKTIPLATASRQITVIVPSQQILLSHVNVPLSQKRHLQKILPFLIEDRLADPLSELHIVADKINDKGDTAFAVVKSALIRRWLDALKEVGLTPDEMVAEVSFLEGQWQLVTDSHTAWLRVDEYESYTVNRVMLPELMVLLHTTYSTVPTVEYTPTDARPLSLQGYDMQVKAAQPLMDIICASFIRNNQSSRMNLLQGEFKLTKRSAPIKALACITVCWFLIMALMTSAEIIWLTYKTTQQREQTVALYKKLFPADSKIIDPRQQMQTHIEGSTSDNKGFLLMLKQMAAYWPKDATSPLQIQNINYHETDGTLTFSVTGNTMDGVNRLAEALNGNGLSVKLQSVVDGKAGVVGQLQVKVAEQ